MRHEAQRLGARALCCVTDAYFRQEALLSPVAAQGLDRLLHGLAHYGPSAYVLLTKAAWLNEALEELLDAFNMLTGMRAARGEPPLLEDELAQCIATLALAISEVHP